MKQAIAVAMLALALAACGDAAEESDDPVPAATETVASEGWPGTYEFEVDGRTTTSTLLADGTYTDTVDGEVVQSGQWEENAAGKVCFDPAGDEAAIACYAAGEVADDGTMVVTPDEGEPLTVRKIG